MYFVCCMNSDRHFGTWKDPAGAPDYATVCTPVVSNICIVLSSTKMPITVCMNNDETFRMTALLCEFLMGDDLRGSSQDYIATFKVTRGGYCLVYGTICDTIM